MRVCLQLSPSSDSVPYDSSSIYSLISDNIESVSLAFLDRFDFSLLKNFNPGMGMGGMTSVSFSNTLIAFTGSFINIRVFALSL